jgi:hypothetical protein
MTTPGPEAMPRTDVWPLSEGEIHYLWWFIQGSIMEPGIRRRLRQAWGVLRAARLGGARGGGGVPAPLPPRVGRAVRGFDGAGLPRIRPGPRSLRDVSQAGPPHDGPVLDVRKRVRTTGSGRGARSALRGRTGRDAGSFLAFAGVTRPYWRATVCGSCAGDQSAPRCRPHLVEHAAHGDRMTVGMHAELAKYILGHLKAYARSSRWECRDTETDEDRAALISAVGWCSGWWAWLARLCAA